MVYWMAPQWQLAACTEVEVGSKEGREAMKARWASLSSAIANMSAVLCWRVWRLYNAGHRMTGNVVESVEPLRLTRDTSVSTNGVDGNASLVHAGTCLYQWNVDCYFGSW